MNLLLTQTANLNNAAIKFLHHEEHLSAVSNLMSALQIVKDLMGAVRWEEEDQDMGMEDEQMSYVRISDISFCAPQESFRCKHSETAGESEQDMLVDCEVYTAHQALHKDLACNDNESAEHHRWHHAVDLLGSTGSFIYQTPLKIWQSALASRELNPELLSELSVALMFNLALCHHLRAMHAFQTRSNDSTKAIFKQAVSLYELAYEVQMQEDVELSVECTMAIVNNLGHIHRYLGNEEKSSKCFSHLLSTLLFVQSSSRCDETEGFHLPVSTTEGFVQSVSHLILKKTVAAAA